MHKVFFEARLETYTNSLGPWSCGSCGLLNKVLDEKKKTWGSCFNLRGSEPSHLQTDVNTAYCLGS